MNVRDVAVVMLRIFALWWFVDAFSYLVDVPAEVYGILHYQLGRTQLTETEKYLAAQREIMLAIVLFKTLVFLALGIAFMAFARPLARLFTRHLDGGTPL